MKKEASAIAKKAIRQARRSSRESVELIHVNHREFVSRLEQANQARESDGKDALSNLRKLKGEKLNLGDEEIIALRLYPEIEGLKRLLRSRGSGIGDFCIKFGITDKSQSSKELHRLVLPPGKSAHSVRLRRSAGKYYELIKAISATTSESISTLADRVLRGTSLHPAEMDNLTETELVQAALQGIVDRIDQEFGLFEKFMKVAELNSKHVLRGGKDIWPRWNWALDDENPSDEDVAEHADPKFAFWKKPFIPNVDQTKKALENLKEFFGSDFNTEPPEAPYWPMGNGCGAIIGSEFFYVPHAPLGVLEFCNLPNPKESPALYLKKKKESIDRWRSASPSGRSWLEEEQSITDEWEETTYSPIGQFGDDGRIGHDFAWLVIYPTPDNTRLCPMIYISYDMGDPFMVSLDLRNLEIFRDALWIGEIEHMSVLDRLKDLLGYRGTTNLIEHGFRRTAPWFAHNPMFKWQAKQDDDLQQLGDFVQKLWSGK